MMKSPFLINIYVLLTSNTTIVTLIY